MEGGWGERVKVEGWEGRGWEDWARGPQAPRCRRRPGTAIVVIGLVPEPAARAAVPIDHLEFAALPPPRRREIEPAWTSDHSLEPANVH